MGTLWHSLPANAQDALILVALLMPAVLIGSVIRRGFAPGPVVGAMIRRHVWTNAIFALLVAASVATGVGLLAQERALRVASAQSADKFDLVIAAPGSEITMLLATVFLQPSNVALLSGETYDAVASHPRVALAAPLAFGDSHDGAPVIGTTAEFVRYLSDDRIDGAMFETYEQAVIGSAMGLEIGDGFEPAHGHGDAAELGVHGTILTVTGRMAPTGTPWDRAILVPVEQVWEAHGMPTGHPIDDPGLGPPFDPAHFPGTPAIVVHGTSLAGLYALQSQFTRDAESMAFFPGTVLSQLHAVMGDVRQAMSLLSLVSQMLVALAILTGLLILTRLFSRQMALLRALGAPARFVFAVVWSQAALLLSTGAALGLMLGFAASALLSDIVSARTDMAVHAALGWPELHATAAFIALASVLSLVPALAVLRQPTVAGLRG
ncbi:MAG: FtsX-like permease family protein [Rhodobacteraceae bacterium]|nr:FtsX-like permease family protein [Paracoccaceae bacterium]